MTPTATGSADATWNPATPWPGWTKWIAQVPLFSGLPRKEQKKVAALAQLKSFAPGKTIVREGGAGDSFFAILSGSARLSTKAGLQHDLNEGACFGELALIDGAPRSGTIVAVGDVTAARIERAAFLELLRREPLIAFSLAVGVVKIIRERESEGTARLTAAFVGAADPEELMNAGRSSKGAAREVAPLLADVPLFAELPQKRLLNVARLAQVRRYAPGTVIARAGIRGSVFYVIAAGRAEAVTGDGQSHVMEPGSFFGELSLLDGGPRAATVRAVDDLVAIKISRTALMKLLDGEPSITLGLLRGLVALFREVERSQA